jgi:hypothetical protein
VLVGATEEQGAAILEQHAASCRVQRQVASWRGQAESLIVARAAKAMHVARLRQHARFLASAEERDGSGEL